MRSANRPSRRHKILGVLPLPSRELTPRQSDSVMRVLLLVSVLMLGACAGQPELPTSWARADGRPVVSGLLDNATLDCKDELRKPDGADGDPDKGGDNRTAADHYVSCMREHGYVQIRS